MAGREDTQQLTGFEVLVSCFVLYEPCSKVEGSRCQSAYKTGGRATGTPNKRTQEAAQILEELDCDPIRGMAEIAMGNPARS